MVERVSDVLRKCLFDPSPLAARESEDDIPVGVEAEEIEECRRLSHIDELEVTLTFRGSSYLARVEAWRKRVAWTVEEERNSVWQADQLVLRGGRDPVEREGMVVSSLTPKRSLKQLPQVSTEETGPESTWIVLS